MPCERWDASLRQTAKSHERYRRMDAFKGFLIIGFVVGSGSLRVECRDSVERLKHTTMVADLHSDCLRRVSTVVRRSFPSFCELRPQSYREVCGLHKDKTDRFWLLSKAHGRKAHVQLHSQRHGRARCSQELRAWDSAWVCIGVFS